MTRDIGRKKDNCPEVEAAELPVSSVARSRVAGPVQQAGRMEGQEEIAFYVSRFTQYVYSIELSINYYSIVGAYEHHRLNQTGSGYRPAFEHR